MANRISTGTVCPFPFAFDPDILDQVNESLLTPDNCTLTFAQVLDPYWAIFQALMFFVFGCIYMPLTILQLYRIKKFAEYKSLSVTSTIQFKLYSVLLFFEACLFFETIDIQGFRNTISPIPYFILDEFAAASTILLALLIIDFFGKTAEGSLNAQGIPTRIYILFMIFALIGYPGMESMGIIFNEYYFVFEATKLYIAALIGASVYLYTNRYVRSILTFLKEQSLRNQRTNVTNNYPGSSKLNSYGSGSLMNTSSSRIGGETNYSQGLVTNVPRKVSGNPRLDPGEVKIAKLCFCDLPCSTWIDRIFFRYNLVPDRHTKAKDHQIKRKNSTQVKLRFEIAHDQYGKAIIPAKSSSGTNLNSSQPNLSSREPEMETTCCGLRNKKKALRMAASETAGQQLERRYRRFVYLLRFVIAFFIILPTLDLLEGGFEWHYEVDDYVTLAGLVVIKLYFAAIVLVVLQLFPVPKIRKDFLQQYDMSLSKTNTTG